MDPKPATSGSPPKRRLWRMQFGMRALLLVMLVCGVAAGGLGGLLRANRTAGTSDSLMPFVLLTVAAPMVVLIVAGVSYSVMEMLDRKKR